MNLGENVGRGNKQICHRVSEIKLMAFNSNFPRVENGSLVIALTEVDSHYVVFEWVENGWSDPRKAADSSNGAATATIGN